ncbi:hypothetical protein [Kitasatospora sp. NPDC047058]|uniref:hypothetical protein n=1 Tax=Kitasatospora sp. NPDC047058 TaxID=3155620 RepID=UPI0033FEA85E
MIKKLPVLAAAVALLLTPMAGTASAETATQSEPVASPAASNTAWFSPDGYSNAVRITQFVAGDGHHYVYGILNSRSSNLALYYDRSTDGGQHWDSFVDRVYVAPGQYALPIKYDDGGVWYRACSAAEWAGNPYGSPEWGYDIACTNWF